MKPTYHGLSKLAKETTVRISTEIINVDGLIQTLENNQEAQMTQEWLDIFKQVTAIYNELFSTGKLSDKTLDNTSYDILQYAMECIPHHEDVMSFEPEADAVGEYFYEYRRSLGVEALSSLLVPHIPDDCDFI